MRLGYISDELIDEVAKRVGVTPLQVNEVLSVLLDAARKPLGKYHVQVCTNISCLLLDGDKLWEHACKRLGIGHKEVTADGQISLEEVECIGRVLVGAGDAGELRFPPRGDARTARPASGRIKEEAIKHAAYNEPNPLEVQSTDAPLRHGELRFHRYLSGDRGYQAFLKAAEMTPEQIIDESEGFQSARPRRRGFSHGHEVELRAADSPKPKYIVVNADESEPGTCKDRVLMEIRSAPVDRRRADRCAGGGRARGYVYIRGEYRYLIDIMDKAIEEAYAKG